MLERDLSEYLMDCPHSSCYRQAFEWDLPLHTEYCIHSPSKCFFCEEMVESGDLVNHLKQKCGGLRVRFERLAFNSSDRSEIRIFNTKTKE